jgi:cellulose synthase/poly-beta-1,6-N-acetylglucosamine synthase-like glycosyltransferase
MMVEIIVAIWLIALVILYYIYHGYLLLLRFLVWEAAKVPTVSLETSMPAVTLLLTVHNEEDRVARCLDSLLALDYDPDRLEIMVASDGSTDRTNEIVRSYAARAPVRLLEFNRLGKSESQNRAIAQARGDIVAFTDADCVPEADYLRELVRPFADKQVGCVTGHLRIANMGGVAREQGYYWSYELKLRELESRLGILAVASGSAMALRRSAFVPLPPDVGEDCMVPLDIVLQSLKVIHATAALATDSMESDPAGEFRARVRMTQRNWTGTWRRAELLNPLRRPGYGLALWSHKVLRWLSPIFVIFASIASLGLVYYPLLWPLPLSTVAFFALAALGWSDRVATATRVPLARPSYAFCLANAGFLVGVLKALAGRSVVTYENILATHGPAEGPVDTGAADARLKQDR